jgi:hypothetical protein
MEPLLKRMLTPDGYNIEQYLLEVIVAYIKRFPNLS